MDAVFLRRAVRTRLEWVSLVAVGVIAASLIATAQTAPQVRQPDDVSFSAEAKAALAEGLDALEAILTDPSWGSGRTFGYAGWGARQFATYTAGVLGERGYSVALVRSDSSTSARMWVLVAISLPGTVAWVPVEPSPAAGQPQISLGRIPMSGRVFDAAYSTYSSVVALPPNAPPTARIRPPATQPNPNRVIQLLALGSFDPDGEIVVYRWDFGDGTTAWFHTETAAHAFGQAGKYTLTLMVVDNGGRSATTSWTISVGSDTSMVDVPREPKSGCGCGG